jgi:hypothetical protein
MNTLHEIYENSFKNELNKLSSKGGWLALGAVSGGLTGAGTGALINKKHRLKGAITGAIGGGVLGATVGLGIGRNAQNTFVKNYATKQGKKLISYSSNLDKKTRLDINDTLKKMKNYSDNNFGLELRDRHGVGTIHLEDVYKKPNIDAIMKIRNIPSKDIKYQNIRDIMRNRKSIRSGDKINKKILQSEYKYEKEISVDEAKNILSKNLQNLSDKRKWSTDKANVMYDNINKMRNDIRS